MNTINGIISTLSNQFKSATGTGLDTIATTPVAVRITEGLFSSDAIPATHADIIEAFTATEGRSPRESELADTESFLLSFGWLA